MNKELKKENGSWKIPIWHFLMTTVLKIVIPLVLMYILGKIFGIEKILMLFVPFLTTKISDGTDFYLQAAIWAPIGIFFLWLSTFLSAKIVNAYYIIKNKKETAKKAALVDLIIFLTSFILLHLLKREDLGKILYGIVNGLLTVALFYLFSKKHIKETK